MDAARLELLRQLGERGSVTAVAAATHQTVSGVSQQLRRLEVEAGVPLTQRVGRGLVLTDAGRVLARTASEMAVAVSKAEARWHEYLNNPEGTVSFVVFPTMGRLLLPRLLERVDEIDGLDLHCSDRDPQPEGFEALTADFDLVLAHAPSPIRSNENILALPLLIETLDIALPADHPLAAKDFLVPSDLFGESWIGNPWGYPFEDALNAMLAGTNRRVEIVQRFSDTGITGALVAAGRGIAGLPSFTAANTYPGRIVLKRLRGITAQRHITILMRRDRAERFAVKTVVDLVRAVAAEVTGSPVTDAVKI